MNLFSRLKAAAMALAGIRHPSEYGDHWFFLPGTRIDYARKVGDGLGSNVLMSPIAWMTRAFLEARLSVVTDDAGGEEFDAAHPLTALMSKPNPFYSGHALESAILYSWFMDGNVYLIKNRAGGSGGAVRELWYAPHWMVKPKWSGGDFISHYEYTPDSGVVRILPADIVHLRNGIDPNNVRKGRAPLKSLMREVFVDDEAANQVARLLANGCIPGLVISPKDGSSVGPGDLEATKAYIQANFSGDNKGAPIALGAPTELQQFGYDPKTMDLSGIRNVSEERVCAILGLPAAIVGFGTGIEQTKVGATLEELSKLAWRNGVIPNQELIAGELTRNLGDDFGLGPNQRMAYDRSRVHTLQDDLNKQSERLARAVGGPWMTIAQARAASGLGVDEATQNIYLIPSTVIPTKPEDLDKPRPVPPAPAPWQPPSAPPKSARRFFVPTKAAIYGKHSEMLRLLDGMAPGMGEVVHGFMAGQAARISKYIAGGMSWRAAEHDRDELAGMLVLSLKRGAQAGLVLERAFIASISKAAVIEVKTSRFSDRMDKWAKVSALKWAGEINETTYAMVDQTLSDALAEGAGVSEAAGMVADALDMERDYRVTRVAQTEMLAALNEGSLEAYRENSQVEGKGWLPTRDQFTRETHLQAGDIYNETNPIPIGEDFQVGDATGPAPGQMSLPEESCNCRCAIFPVVKEMP